MKVVLLANWGLGFELLKTLHKIKDVAIEMVITQYEQGSSDKWYNAVYNFACKEGYNVVKQNKLNFSFLKEHIVSKKIDLLITHAFMKILPSEVFNVPKYGSMNIHPSLLPKYRGPSPTYWVLKNREKVTGLTCHFIDNGIDTGNIISQRKITVESHDTISSIIEKQKMIIGELVIESLKHLHDITFKPVVQKEDLATYAPKPEQKGNFVS